MFKLEIFKKAAVLLTALILMYNEFFGTFF
ncbi:MAG: hypothetical protein XD50_0986 [Clostridia bacterium 41_269]|nr:MAG: hypothetical protein XD50_0986 [Clostridia bacterium 41_269]